MNYHVEVSRNFDIQFNILVLFFYDEGNDLVITTEKIFNGMHNIEDMVFFSLRCRAVVLTVPIMKSN